MLIDFNFGKSRSWKFASACAASYEFEATLIANQKLTLLPDGIDRYIDPDRGVFSLRFCRCINAFAEFQTMFCQ